MRNGSLCFEDWKVKRHLNRFDEGGNIFVISWWEKWMFQKWVNVKSVIFKYGMITNPSSKIFRCNVRIFFQTHYSNTIQNPIMGQMSLNDDFPYSRYGVALRLSNIRSSQALCLRLNPMHYIISYASVYLNNYEQLIAQLGRTMHKANND